MSHTLIIAEAGSCHDGSIEKALRLVDVAKACGADSVKFQYWSSPERLAARRHAPDSLATYRQYQIPPNWLPILHDHANTVGLEFMCTAYVPEDLETVAPFVQRFKVSSFEASDRAFLAAHARFDKPVIVSTGLSSDAEAQNTFRPSSEWSRLHCVSAYPAPIDELNLAAIASGFDGFSDHSGHVLTGAIAVACGARILEVHVRLLDTDDENPDYATALSPYELMEYIQNVRDAERMLGDGLKRRMPSEEPLSRYRVTP